MFSDLDLVVEQASPAVPSHSTNAEAASRWFSVLGRCPRCRGFSTKVGRSTCVDGASAHIGDREFGGVTSAITSLLGIGVGLRVGKAGIGKGLDMMRVVPLAVAALCAGTASAEVSSTMLDIPSGSGSDIQWSSSAALEAIPFSIDAENVAFRGGNHATFGVVRAWDVENNSDATAKIDLTANDGFMFTSISFDLSGFKTYASSARFKIYTDSGLWIDKTWSFDGNSTLIHKEWFLPEESSTLRIRLINLSGTPYNGLDNIGIGTVPAPGALALLGVSGLLGGGRRRR